MIDVPVKVKDALREGTYRKNYRFKVLNDDGTVYQIIENSNLVKESVSIDERMNSGDKLKFGLCEGSSLEFQYFGIPNITGRTIQAFIDIEYDATGDYIKVDEFEEGVENTVSEGGYYKVYSNTPNAWTKVIVRSGITTIEYTPTSTATETYQDLVLTSWDSLEVVWGSIDPATHPVELQKMVEGLQWYTIPMGFFTVEKCSRQASTGIIKVTAYNKLMSDYLDAKANTLLMESFDNPEQTVLFKDIRNILLSDYEIIEDEGTPITIGRATYGAGSLHRMGSSSVKFVDGYVDSPINYETYTGASSLSKTVYPFLCASESKAVLDADKVYKISFEYDIESLEQTYYDELQRLSTISLNVDESFMQRFINPSTWSGYVPYLGWHTYFGVGVERSNGQMEYYSTIAYENHLNNVVGSFSDLTKKTFTDCVAVYFFIPYTFELHSTNSGTSDYSVSVRFYGSHNYKYHGDTKQYKWYDPNGVLTDYQWTLDGWNEVYKYEYSEADKVEVIPSEMGEFTLREIISASYETQCQYGQLDRETDLFSGVELNNSRLYPQDTLYPSTSLYPGGAAASAFRSTYSKLWADEGNVRKWKYLIITYKGLDGQGNEVDKTLQKTVNADGTDNYNCSDNWLFRNLVWASEDVDDYAEAMKAKMQNITWFPFEMWAAGLPYLETGDEIEIPLGENTYKSYILQRQLKGIQDLQDTFINGTLDVY